MEAPEGPSEVKALVRLSKMIEIVLTEAGLTMNQFHLLSLVDEGESIPSVLGRRLVMKPPNVTTMVTGMIDRGLIASVRGQDDRRQTQLSLTDAGRAALENAQQKCARALSHVAAAAQPDDPDGLTASLGSWLRGLNVELVAFRSAIAGEQSA